MDIGMLTELFNQGIQLIGHIHDAAQHHHLNPVVNYDNAAVVGDLAVIGAKLHEQGKAYYKTKSAPSVSCCDWEEETQSCILAYNKQTGAVALHYARQNGGGYSSYFGSGDVYNDSMDILVSGFNSLGQRLIIRFISKDGRRATVITECAGYEAGYNVAIRTSNWYWG